MGLSRVKGPWAGAYTVLTFYVDAVATGQTDSEVGEFLLPAGMDFVVTNIQAYAITAGVAAATVDVEDDGGTLMTGNITVAAGTATAGTLATTMPTGATLWRLNQAGGTAGIRVAAGSRITADVTTGDTTAPADITVYVMGFPETHSTGVLGFGEARQDGTFA